MEECTRRHELIHLPDIQPCDPRDPPGLSIFKPGVGTDSECRAYRESLKCLKGNLAKCDALLNGTGLDPSDKKLNVLLQPNLTPEQRCALANWRKCKNTLLAQIRNDEAGVRNNCPPEDPIKDAKPPVLEKSANGMRIYDLGYTIAACPEMTRW